MVKKSLKLCLEKDMRRFVKNEVKEVSDPAKREALMENMLRMGNIMVERVLSKAVQLDNLHGVQPQTKVYRSIYREVRSVLGSESDVLGVYQHENRNSPFLYRLIAVRPSPTHPGHDECIIWVYNETTESLGYGRYGLTCEQAVGVLFTRYFTA